MFSPTPSPRRESRRGGRRRRGELPKQITARIRHAKKKKETCFLRSTCCGHNNSNITFNLLSPQQLQRNNHLITLKFSGCQFTGPRCFYSLFLSLSFRVELTRLVSSVLYSCSTLVDHTDSVSEFNHPTIYYYYYSS